MRQLGEGYSSVLCTVLLRYIIYVTQNLLILNIQFNAF